MILKIRQTANQNFVLSTLPFKNDICYFRTGINHFYNLSYLWKNLFGCLVTMFGCVLFSYLIGKHDVNSRVGKHDVNDRVGKHDVNSRVGKHDVNGRVG